MDQTLIRNESWRRGLLQWKLRPVQLKMWRSITENESLKFTINSSRRIGKSYLLCVIALEQALKKPMSMIRFAAPTQKALKKIIQPHLSKILNDCPIHLRPTYKTQEQVYVFANGSEIHLAGANSGHAENLRGTEAHLFIIDEAGFVDNLKYLIDDIAIPQCLTTGGKLIMASTPPRTPAHDFAEYAHNAKLEGNYSHFTIYDANYDETIIDTFKKEAGGEESTTWRREYLADFIVDEDYALVPEWKESFVQPFEKDPHWTYHFKYESLDVGVRDLTVCLFAHYNFKEAKLYVHDEVVMSGPKMTTERLATAIREKETSVFGNEKIHRRVSDIDLLLINDLSFLHNLSFSPTDKGELEQMINEVRIWVGAGRVVVHPRCQQLIGCLKYGVWNEARKQFDRSKAYGHFDALAALMYLIRNVDTRTNPVPPFLGMNREDLIIISTQPSKRDVFIKAFGGHNRR